MGEDKFQASVNVSSFQSMIKERTNSLGYQWKVCIVWMEVLFFGFPMAPHVYLFQKEKDIFSRRKVASTEQFIKQKVQSRWERGQVLQGGAWYWVLLGLFGLGGAATHGGEVFTGGCFQSFGKFPPQVERRDFWLYKVCIQQSRWGQGEGAVTVIQMHNNGSRGYPGAEVQRWKGK